MVYVISPNDYVNTLVNLAGGFGQALSSFLSFLLVRYYLVKSGTTNILQTEVLEERTSKPTNFIFGFEASFLTMAVFGIINGIIEGFCYDLYLNVHSNANFWWGILGLSLLTVSLVLYNYQSKYLS